MKAATAKNSVLHPIYDLYLAAYLRVGPNLSLSRLRFANGGGNRIEFCFEAGEAEVETAIRTYFNREGQVDARTFADEVVALKTQLYAIKHGKADGGAGDYEHPNAKHARG